MASFKLLWALLFATSALAQSLADVCTVSYVADNLPSADDFNGLIFDVSSVTANAVYNASANGQNNFVSATGLNYCNVTLSYSHAGRTNDTYNLWYYLPEPSSFQNRFLATGGGGEAINSGASSLAQGIINGAVAGLTDGGFGSFNNEITDVLLLANGTINYEALYSFGYKGIHEMTIVGKQLAKNFYNASSIYSYYFGCSEGGREGWSQVQRYGKQFDGAVIGAPAIRQAYQQVNHLSSGVIETQMNYYPPPCELERILNDTIAFCDPLDGKTDGVVSRTDLCRLQFNANSSIGNSYYCAASGGMGGGMGGPPSKRQIGGGGATTPAQNGTVTAEGAAVAQSIVDGLFDSEGRQIYMSYQPSATFSDAQTSYNSTSDEWYITASGIGVTWVNMFLDEVDSDSLSLDNVTADTLREWILEGLQKYSSTMQTVWPDLEEFHDAGGKVLSYHGESDFSIPTISSVIYQDSVRQVMYPNMTYNESMAKINDWYRLFLVPGAGHCGPSDTQPNGPWPLTTLETLIQWVEDDVKPETLNGTVTEGDEEGDSQQICAFPLRPHWSGNNTSVTCIYPDDAALDTWFPDLNSIPLPVY